jgi:acyl transferase domain-containing protein
MTQLQPSCDDKDLLLRRALAALSELRGKFESLERTRTEPIAIVGIGVRYPGAVDSPTGLWDLLQQGRDAVVEVSPERRALAGLERDAPHPLKHAALIEHPEHFDPYFFGISPREASQLDPQQRLFLEVAWHALEDAGISLEAIAGSECGVFVGANSTDYLQLQMARPDTLDTYSLVGGVNCIIANRLSYFLDLRGPSLTIDTACSSSLVAVHQACQSLRSAEIPLAIVGGVNVVLSAALAQAHAVGLPLAPDGRCKTFDARANGYVRGEGCGVVILKRLSAALQAGDDIWAVIHGSAINQDGLSNGLTAPSGVAQRAVIRKALANARLRGQDVSFVEAHGTGTALGDPIEVEALNEIYGVAQPDTGVCAIGTLKTNLGHLEAGAGIAGLIKAALSLRHAAIPPNLHFEQLNPIISLEASRLHVPRALMPWDGARRYAAVSSFGAGGTNAHVILGTGEQAVQNGASSSNTDDALLVLSARSASALRTLATRWSRLLATAEAKQHAWVDWCASAAHRRSHHKYRLSVVARSHGEAAEALLRSAEQPGQASLKPAAANRRIVFVFADDPSVVLLHDRVPDCLSRSYQRCLAALERESQRYGLPAPSTAAPRGDIRLLFARQVAIAETLATWAVEPRAVLAVGTGTIAAAYIAQQIAWPVAVDLACQAQAQLQGSPGVDRAELVARLVAAELAHDGSGDANVELHLSARFPELTTGVERLLLSDHDLFVQLEPDALAALGDAGRAAPMLQEEVVQLSASSSSADLGVTLLRAAGRLYEAGASIQLGKVVAPSVYLKMPLYPFDHEAYWFCENEQPAAPASKEPAQALVNRAQPARRAEEAPRSPSKPGAILNIRELVHAEVARVLRFDAARLDPKLGFFELGMDSVMATQLRNRLERALGRKCPTTMILEHPTVETLARHLGDERQPPRATGAPRLAARHVARDDENPTHFDVAALLARELEEAESSENLS